MLMIKMLFIDFCNNKTTEIQLKMKTADVKTIENPSDENNLLFSNPSVISKMKTPEKNIRTTFNIRINQ